MHFAWQFALVKHRVPVSNLDQSTSELIKILQQKIRTFKTDRVFKLINGVFLFFLFTWKTTLIVAQQFNILVGFGMFHIEILD